jgi:Zn finger protein HypA/HybF involved in hydrogenase expression
MSGLWLIVCLFLPPAAAFLARILIRPNRPSPQVIVALNAILPGSGLAAAGRPLIETVLGVMLAQFSLMVVGSPADLGYYVPFMVVGGFWALVHTDLSPLKTASRPTIITASSAGSPPTDSRTTSAPTPKPTIPTSDDKFASDEYCIEVRCTECGADILVPVLQHMIRCEFCGSDHLVIGQDGTLQVAIPERVTDKETLTEAVLDHYRYQHYLKLYQRHVAPLERQASEVSPTGQMIENRQAAVAAAAAEATISKRADAHRAKLQRSIELEVSSHFLAPYRHGMGTLYQTAFGRERRDGEKALVFVIGNQEGATLATDLTGLPEMGKLSYLRKLVSAANTDPEMLSLPLTRGSEALDKAYGDLDRKRLVREIDVIRHGNAFVQEVEAVVWRPWWIVSVRASGINEMLLVDGGAGSVAGPPPVVDPSVLQPLPASAREPGASLRFLAMECPVCGFEFQFDNDAVLHFCTNCHRVFDVVGNSKHQIEYDHSSAIEGEHEFVPFWRFPLKLQTADRQTITDLRFLKDGIDGRLDQIGDEAVLKQHSIVVPAIRCINSKLMARTFNQLLLHTIRSKWKLNKGRFPLESKLEPLPTQLTETEARQVAPLFLASIFSKRDLARVNVNQVSAWLFESKLKSTGTLTFLAVPRKLTEPFRRYLGRSHGRTIRQATTTSQGG